MNSFHFIGLLFLCGFALGDVTNGTQDCSQIQDYDEFVDCVVKELDPDISGEDSDEGSGQGSDEDV